MRYKMNLQLFEDGTGAGSAGGQSRNTGTGGGGQNTAGSAAGHMEPERILMSSWKKSQMQGQKGQKEQRWANFFRGQGMTEEEVTQAITDFKTQRAANQPKTEQLQQERMMH